LIHNPFGNQTMIQSILNATVAMALCCATTMAENGDAKPARPKPLVTESAKTTFPLGPVEELPEVRKHLLDLCTNVRIGLEPDTLDKVIQSSVDPAPARKALSKEAGVQITKFNAEFRQMLREKAGVVVDAFFDDMKKRAPKTATVTAWASHPEGGMIPYSWKVEGLAGRTSISYKAKQPVAMRKTLKLKVPGEDTTLEMPLKWTGKVSIDAVWSVECADHVTGVINTPKTEVRAQRWCRPKLNVDVRCEWPLSAGPAGANHQDAPARVTGNHFEEWGSGIGLNCRAGKYVIPLKAGKPLVLDQPPLLKPREPAPSKVNSGNPEEPTE